MKKFKTFFSVLLVCILTFSLVACGKKATIVGTWIDEDENVTFTFNDDETGSLSVGGITMDITSYNVEGDKIHVTIDMGILGQEEEEYTYSLDKKSLTLKERTGYEYSLKKK